MDNIFKLIAMGRVGTLAMNRWLDDHPEISLPGYTLTKLVFLNSNKATLNELAHDKTSQIKRKGMVIHDHPFFYKKHRKHLANINDIPADKIIHMVRNPFEQVIGWINHINASAAAGLLSWYHIDPSVKGLYQRYKDIIPTMLPGQQCQKLYKNQKQVMAIDFSEISAENGEETLQKVYGFLGVDENFTTPMVKETQNNYTRSLLLSGIKFELNNEVVHMRMAPISLFNLLEKNSKPWVTIHDMDKVFELCPSVTPISGDIVFFPADVAEANKLSLKTRQMLHENTESIVQELLPVWAENAESAVKKSEEMKLHKLSEEDITLLTQLCGRDFHIFTKFHPRFKTLWNF